MRVGEWRAGAFISWPEWGRIFPPCRIGAALRREGEVKRGAFAGFAFGPGTPAVAGDDAAHVGEADPAAFKFVRSVQPLEHPEQLVRILHVEAHAVVAHEQDDLP